MLASISPSSFLAGMVLPLLHVHHPQLPLQIFTNPAATVAASASFGSSTCGDCTHASLLESYRETDYCLGSLREREREMRVLQFAFELEPLVPFDQRRHSLNRIRQKVK